MNPVPLPEIFVSILCYISKNALAFASFVISGIALIITWIKNVKDRRRADDKELLEQLKFTLEHAYGSIAIALKDSDLPKKDRLGWLSAARHLSRYWQLKRAINTKIYMIICDEQEEYWRHKFYLLLQRISESNFFVWINQDQMDEETVDPKSAAIVYAFSQWKEGLPDPLDDWSFEEVVARYNLFSPLNRYFKGFIEAKFPELAERAKKISVGKV